MPGFDPNEPRDAFGKWVATTSDIAGVATQRAASDNKPADVSKQEDQIRELLKDKRFLNENAIVSLSGLTTDQADDLVSVIDDMTNGGTVKIPITNVYVCGQEFNSLCNSNSNAGAFYGFDFLDRKGQLFINPQNIQTDFQYQETPTWDQKIDHVYDLLKQAREKSWKFGNMDGGTIDYLTKSIEAYKDEMRNKEPDRPYNAALKIKDADERFKAIVYHEMGHMILKKEFFESHPNQSNYSVVHDYHEWRDRNLPVVQPNSDYGKTNSDEYFAEWYGSYKVGRVKASELPNQVKFIIDRNPL